VVLSVLRTQGFQSVEQVQAVEVVVWWQDYLLQEELFQLVAW
jgi:hypothetical protein